jgi:hypothetical protein
LVLFSLNDWVVQIGFLNGFNVASKIAVTVAQLRIRISYPFHSSTGNAHVNSSLLVPSFPYFTP